ESFASGELLFHEVLSSSRVNRRHWVRSQSHRTASTGTTRPWCCDTIVQSIGLHIPAVILASHSLHPQENRHGFQAAVDDRCNCCSRNSQGDRSSCRGRRAVS